MNTGFSVQRMSKQGNMLDFVSTRLAKYVAPGHPVVNVLF